MKPSNKYRCIYSHSLKKTVGSRTNWRRNPRKLWMKLIKIKVPNVSGMVDIFITHHPAGNMQRIAIWCYLQCWRRLNMWPYKLANSWPSSLVHVWRWHSTLEINTKLDFSKWEVVSFMYKKSWKTGQHITCFEFPKPQLECIWTRCVFIQCHFMLQHFMQSYTSWHLTSPNLWEKSSFLQHR